MIYLTRRDGHNEVAVNPDHIIYMNEGATYDTWSDRLPTDPPKAISTWTILALTHAGGTDRTELHVTESMADIVKLIREDD